MPRQFGVRGFRLGRALDFNMSLHVEELQVYDSLPLGASAYDTCYTVTRSTMAAPMGASTTGDGAVPLAVRLPLTWFFLTPRRPLERGMAEPVGPSSEASPPSASALNRNCQNVTAAVV